MIYDMIDIYVCKNSSHIQRGIMNEELSWTDNDHDHNLT